jgi:hypothetical protein
MRHQRKTRRMKGGAWYDPSTWFKQKPEEAVAALPGAAEDAVQDTAQAVGLDTPPAPEGLPGGPVGGKRKRTRKHKRKSRRKH